MPNEPVPVVVIFLIALISLLESRTIALLAVAVPNVTSNTFNWVEVISDTAILPLPLLINALDVSKSTLLIVVVAPVSVACLLLICVWILLETPSK